MVVLMKLRLQQSKPEYFTKASIHYEELLIPFLCEVA
jgi:hypothetical protein